MIGQLSRKRLVALRFAVVLTVWALGAGGKLARATDLSGRWHGNWKSCTDGHSGPLNASFCKLDDTQYRVNFSGRFLKIIPFQYSVTLNVVSDIDGVVKLAGDSYLGRRYGTFHYEATATETKFTADYTSCKDDGRFVLSRCCSTCGK